MSARNASQIEANAPERTVDESLDGDIGVWVADSVENVAVPKSGERGGPDEGGILE